MRITIKEIARLAGVHRATVDKVLHQRIGVSDEVRKRVQAIIDEVEYTPNPIGMALQKQKDTFHICVILLNVDAKPYLLQGVQQQLHQWESFDIKTTVQSTCFQDIGGQVALIEQAISQHADGIVLCPINTEPVRQAVANAAWAKIPVVTVNSDLPSAERLGFVGQDSEQVSRIAGHLMGEFVGAQGEIAVITSSINSQNNNYYVEIREKSFIRYVDKEFPNIKILDRIESMEDPQVTFEKTMQLLERKPSLSGIYITCGGVAEVGRALEATKRRVKTLCFEDYPDVLDLLKRGVIDCTISSDLNGQGSLAAKLLLDYIIYGTTVKQQEFFTESKVLLKESIS